jgi:acyl-CoA synthetase (NDP forming)
LLLADAQRRGVRWLNAQDVRRLLLSYGLPILEQRVVGTPAEAGLAAGDFGGLVALKAVAPGLIHKSDAGAVRLNLAAAAVESAASEIAESVRTAAGVAPTGYLVQPMAAAGVEMLIGVVNDPRFGPVVACGAGGTLVELVKDVAVRLSPLTPADAASMPRELRSFPLLEGYRGAPACDVAALEEVLLRTSALVEDHPSILEMDLNPVIVGPHGAVVVDARVRVGAAPPRRPLGARR